MYWKALILVLPMISHEAWGSPKKYQPEESGGFSPIHRYYESELSQYNQDKNKSTYVPKNPIGEDKSSTNLKESRFGSISYGPTGSGYGNGMSYGTMKLDLGGVALGALIGLGAILVIPKIAQVFAGGHGGYRRSLEEEMSSVTNLLAKVDNSLAANDIDSTSCAQAAICTFVRDAMKNNKAGEMTSVDELVLSFTGNPLFNYVADGTAIKEAVETGRSQDADKCKNTYTKCPLNRENILKVVGSFIPAN